MRDLPEIAAESAVWGPYASYDDVARFEYGRRFWRIPEMRRRLVAHWLDARHPHRERFLEQRALIEDVLGSDESVPARDSPRLWSVVRRYRYWQLTRAHDLVNNDRLRKPGAEFGARDGSRQIVK
jgi:hypothetical protein